MIGILQAETLKLLRHRGIWGLVWIVPIGMVLIWTIGMGLHLSHAIEASNPKIPVTAASWISNTAVTWKFCASSMVRYLVGGFAALAFAGEYGWSTWKLIVPHRSRASLIIAKYVIVTALPMVAFVITAILSVVLSLVEAGVLGPALPAGIGFGALLAAHAAGFAATLITTLLTIAYAAAGALLFRSTLAGVIVAIAAVTLERLAGTFSILLPKWLVMVLPSYHVDNVLSWIGNGAAAPLMLASEVTELGWAVSAFAVAAWIAGLIGLSWASFRQQDLV